jgi:hypothetical protein
MWNKMKIAAQIKNRIKERERERETERKNGAPKSYVLTSGSLVAKPKSGPDYSVI